MKKEYLYPDMQLVSFRQIEAIADGMSIVINDEPVDDEEKLD